MTSHTARRLPEHRGPAVWNAILPVQEPPQPLTGPLTADFAVIGAGFAGLSAARRLAQLNSGARVVVVEAGRLAEVASGRNSGFMIDLPHDLSSEDYSGHGTEADRLTIEMNRAAIDFACVAVADYGMAPAFFDPAGKIKGAATLHADALNRSYAQHLAAMGEASERLDAQAMQALTGSSHYVSGLYTRGTVMIQPAGYVRAFAAGLRGDGVTICENTPVTAIRKAGPDWQFKPRRAPSRRPRSF